MSGKNEKFVKVGIGVLVMNEKGEILLGKRKGELGKNTFSLAGGHLEFGESFEECARRELKEETGLDGSEFEIISLENGAGKNKHYVTIGVWAKKVEGECKLMEPEKFESWEWYPKNNLPRPLFGPSEGTIENYFSGRFYKP